MSQKSGDKVGIATKHPGVFMDSSDFETETGIKMPKPEDETPNPEIDHPDGALSSSEEVEDIPSAEEMETTEEDDDEAELVEEHEVENVVEEIQEEVQQNPEYIEPTIEEEEDAAEPNGENVCEDSRSELICNESVCDVVEDEKMEPLTLSDDEEIREKKSRSGRSSKADDLEDEKMESLTLSEEDEDYEKKRKGSSKGPRRKRKDSLSKATLKRELSVEVEISQGEKLDEEVGVTTRRSQRRKTRIEDPFSSYFEVIDSKLEEAEVKEEEPAADQVTEEDDIADVESITSEIDSLESGSTFTARSLNRRGSRVSNKKSGNKKCRKSSQFFTKSKARTAATSNSTQHKGKSRRVIFKKSSTKAPNSVARAVTSDRVAYKGQYFTKGDVVSVTDIDGGIFYAQLRGFLTDQYCEKSCVITWLLPTTQSPNPDEGFDPATYIVGPEEELPRKLEYFTFVMHAPDDYFYYKNAPYPTEAINTDQEYVLTRVGPKVRLINSAGKAYYSDV